MPQANGQHAQAKGPHLPPAQQEGGAHQRRALGDPGHGDPHAAQLERHGDGQENDRDGQGKEGHFRRRGGSPDGHEGEKRVEQGEPQGDEAEPLPIVVPENVVGEGEERHGVQRHQRQIRDAGRTPPQQVEEAGGAGQDEEHSAESNLCHDGVVIGEPAGPEEENPVGAGPADQIEPPPVAEGGNRQDAGVDHQDVRQSQADVRQVRPEQGRGQERANYAQQRHDHGLVAQGQQGGQRHHQGQEEQGHVGTYQLVQSEGGVDGQVEDDRAGRRYGLCPDGDAALGILAHAQ